MTDIFGYLGCNFKIISTQIDIISHQRHTGTNSDYPGCRMASGRTVIGMPFGQFHFLGHPFELSFANSCQIFTMRGCRRFLIKEDRKVIKPGYLLSYLPGKRDGFVHRHVFNGNKGHYINGPHAGMLPPVVIKIYQFHSHSNSLDNSITQSFRLADKGYYQSVVIFIIAIIEQFHPRPGTERSDNTIYLFQIPPFTEVGDAFYYFIPVHTTSF